MYFSSYLIKCIYWSRGLFQVLLMEGNSTFDPTAVNAPLPTLPLKLLRYFKMLGPNLAIEISHVNLRKA